MPGTLELEKFRGFETYALNDFSYDCIQALSSLVGSRPDLAGEVSIHKIGRSIRKAVHLDAEDLQVAVEQKIEVR